MASSVIFSRSAFSAVEPPYDYEHLYMEEVSTRIIRLKPAHDFEERLHCEVIVINLRTNGHPDYEAISYTWGGQKPSKIIISYVYGSQSPDSRTSLDSSDSLNYPSLDSYESLSALNSPLVSYSSNFEQGVTSASPSDLLSTISASSNIEMGGDARIERSPFYTFIVTKTEAYYRLQPGYAPSVKYPSIWKPEKLITGERYPCGMMGCKAEPFVRHYDLERHFTTIHQANKEKAGEEQDRKEQGNKEQGEKLLMYCDYKRCGHIAQFRKDHCREHYREYHTEDLIKRGQPKPSKPKNSKKRPGTVEEFLAARIKNLNLGWWRCSNCIRRVYVNSDEYTCPNCNLACEPERVTFRENEAMRRENARRRENAPNTAKSSPGFDSAET